MSKELPERKPTRLKNFDYSSKGACFVTICISDRKPILSDVIKPCGRGRRLDDPFDSVCDVPRIRLTRIGEIIEKCLLSSETIPGVKIDRYVIMPDHIHVIVFLDPNEYVKREDGSSRAPTPTNQMLPHVISAFKRFCNKEIGDKIFQRGYIDHIVRDMEDYKIRVKYIYENPIRWYYRELYREE